MNNYLRRYYEDHPPITISGKISSMFHGLTITEETRSQVYLQLLGQPVKDDQGNIIGKITCLDMDNDLWYAKLTGSATDAIFTQPLPTISMEIKE